MLAADPVIGPRDRIAALSSELDTARDEQAATRGILRIISTMGPGSRLEPVLTEIVATAARLCAAEYALAYVLKDDGRYHTIAANEADAALVRYAVEHPLLPGRGSLIGRTALEKRAVHVDDCLTDPDYAFPEFQRIGRFRTMLGVPLLRDGMVVGALGLLRSVVSPFTARQIELVTTFAHQAVIALEHVRFFEHEQARTRELTAYFKPLDVPVSRGSVTGRAALDGRVAQITDVLADPEYTWSGAQEIGGYRAAMGVPLLRDNEVIGVIFIGRTKPECFSAKQVELARTFADQAVIALENARLFQEVQARTGELQESLEHQTATGEVLNIISRAPSQLQPVFDTIVKSAARLCEADSATVFQLADDGNYHLVANHGYSPEYESLLRSRPLSPGRGTAVGRMALTRATVHIPDTLADPEYTFLQAQKLGGYRSILAVPLLRDGNAVAAIALGRSTVRPFSEKQIELVQTFAEQAVIAIQNMRLFEEVQARTAELQEALEYQTATSEVLNVISRSTFDLQPVLNTMVESAGRLCQAENVQIFLRDGEVYRLVAHNGFSPQYQEYVRQHPIEPGRGTLVARTALEVSPIHIPDVLCDPEYTWHEGRKLAGFRAALGVPLLREGSCVGVMAMTRSTPLSFTDKQIELVTTFADQAVIAISNVSLLEELQQSLEHQTATSDVLNVISRSPNELKPVLDAIAGTAAKLCDAYDVIITLRDGEDLQVAAHHGPIPVDFLKWPIRRGWVTGRAVADRKPFHVEDLVAAADEFPDGHAMAVRQGHRTILATPLLREDVAVGAISLRRNEVRPFSAKQIALLQTFADQAVIAINNVRLFEEVQTRTEELQEALEQQTATAEVLQVISRSTFDLQTVLDTLVESAARLCNADSATITKQVGNDYLRAAVHGFSPEATAYLKGSPVEWNRGSGTGRTLIDAKIVHVPDVEADPEYTWREAKELGRFRSMLGVPLLRQGTPIGALVLTRNRVEPFTEKQIELAKTFADQAVIAIENARLFEEVQARTRELAKSVGELRALGEVSQAVNSTLDLETVLSTIVAKAVQLSATEAGAIYVFSKLRQKFRLRATYGMSEAMIADIGKQSVGLGDSYIGKAASSGDAVQVPDLTAEPASPVRDLVLGAGYRALLVLPLMRPGGVVGALVVRRKEPGLFPSSTIDLLQTFAAQSVLAIQNARLFEEVEARTRELAKSLEELRAAQERLIQTEKLASLGQLTAGIAHEIKNPLNFVNNFAALSIELVDELKDALRSASEDEEQTAELMALLAGNLEKVVQHGKRADSIVKNMLLHSRAGSGEHRLADINALVEESLNLAYHGARAEQQGFNVTIERSLDPSAGELELLPQEITRVFLNLISNGFYATLKRKERAIGPYEPILFAGTRNLGDHVEIRIRDNGTGIPPEVKEKMFDPFFTTKPAGEGTGLGLSLSHDIVVKQHRGSIEVDTSPGEYTEFRIVLPRSGGERMGP
ncbi:MAG: Adenylate cyclase [Microvirga sp.]|nr:Adenylate cyclase [Microvirga sp.]